VDGVSHAALISACDYGGDLIELALRQGKCLGKTWIAIGSAALARRNTWSLRLVLHFPVADDGSLFVVNIMLAVVGDEEHQRSCSISRSCRSYRLL
jgi:hypothetical protein